MIRHPHFLPVRRERDEPGPIARSDPLQEPGVVRVREIKDELTKNTERSVERGTFGSPTFYVGDEIFFGKDRLRDIEEMIA